MSANFARADMNNAHNALTPPGQGLQSEVGRLCRLCSESVSDNTLLIRSARPYRGGCRICLTILMSCSGAADSPLAERIVYVDRNIRR